MRFLPIILLASIIALIGLCTSVAVQVKVSAQVINTRQNPGDKQDDPQLRQQLLSAWNKYATEARRWFRERSERRFYRDNVMYIQHKRAFKRRSDAVCIEVWLIQHQKSGQQLVRGVVKCANPAYAFQLEAKNQGSAWALQTAISASNKAQYEKFSKELLESFPGESMLVPPSLVDLRELLGLPGRVVYRISSDSEEGHLITVAIENRSSEMPRDYAESVRYVVLSLNRECYYAPMKVRYERDTGMQKWGRILHKGDFTLECEVNRRGIPMPVKAYGISESWDYKATGELYEDSPSRIRIEHECYIEDEGREPGREEFMLSYYGIPEPEELRWRPTPWWLYILLAGLALVILSFGIYAWRRHRRAAFA